MGKGNEHRSKERNESGNRTPRLQQLIREELSFLLRAELGDPRLDGVSVTRVELNGDCARVWFSADDEREQLETLQRAAGFLRGHLAESLGLKRTPELRFRRDRATRAFDEE